jgi:hypothetical protein
VERVEKLEREDSSRCVPCCRQPTLSKQLHDIAVSSNVRSTATISDLDGMLAVNMDNGKVTNERSRSCTRFATMVQLNDETKLGEADSFVVASTRNLEV